MKLSKGKFLLDKVKHAKLSNWKIEKRGQNTQVGSKFAFVGMPHMLGTFYNSFVFSKSTGPVKYQTVLEISLHHDLQIILEISSYTSLSTIT